MSLKSDRAGAVRVASLVSGPSSSRFLLRLQTAGIEQVEAETHYRQAVREVAGIVSEGDKASAYFRIAEVQAANGHCGFALITVSKILVDTVKHLPGIGEEVAQRRDLVAFKQYLHLAGRDIRTAIHACGQLAILYPADATAIAELLLARQPRAG